jgi:MFS family permease
MDVTDRSSEGEGPEPPAQPPIPDYEPPVGELRGPQLRRTLSVITIAWLFGSVWATAVAGTPVTNFAKALGASNFQFGVLSALPFIASLLSLPASLLIEATGKRKRIFLWGLYFQRLMWFPLALLPLWLVWLYGESAYAPAMAMFLALIFLMHAGNAVGGPAWVSWMADIVPDRARGTYFSRRRQWGILTALPTAFLVGWVLDHNTAGGDTFNMLWWCAIVFMAAGVFGTLDIALFQWVPDIPRQPQRGLRLLRAWREPLKNRRFLWFAGFVATLVFAVSFMGQFVTLYVMEQTAGGGSAGQVNMITQLMLIVAPSAAQLLVLAVWGRAADRMGKRPLLIISALGLVPVGLGWCFLTPQTVWLGYLLSAGGAALWAGVEVANFNYVLELSGNADQANNNARGGSAYVAVNSVIINIAGCLGGLASGAIAEALRDWRWQTAWKTFTHYDVLFILSAALRLVSVVIFLPHMREPDARPTREAFRFMTANIYNNLLSAVLEPLRYLGLVKRPSYDPRARDEE